MIEFTHLWAFVLVLLPVLVFLLLPAHRQSRDSLQVPYFDRLVNLSGAEPVRGATVMQRKRVQTVLLWLAWLCLVTAAAKPEWVGEPVVIDKSARDVMIAVDLSGSMEVEDFVTQAGKKINRLQAIKEVLEEFARRREGDRLGLIVFGDAAYLQAPFTTDKDTWLTLLSETEIAMAGPSTVIGDAIGLAISTFKGSDSENRVLILLTDGNDTGSRVPPIDAARVAAAYDVTIYTIAIGDPATIGEEAMDSDTLKEIATITGGAYFEALDQQSLAGAYQEIEAMEPELFESLSFRPRQGLFHIPLIVVAMMYLMAMPLMAFAGIKQRKKVING